LCFQITGLLLVNEQKGVSVSDLNSFDRKGLQYRGASHCHCFFEYDAQITCLIEAGNFMSIDVLLSWMAAATCRRVRPFQISRTVFGLTPYSRATAADDAMRLNAPTCISCLMRMIWEAFSMVRTFFPLPRHWLACLLLRSCSMMQDVETYGMVLETVGSIHPSDIFLHPNPRTIILITLRI
jgi:hypothetical protein